MGVPKIVFFLVATNNNMIEETYGRLLALARRELLLRPDDQVLAALCEHYAEEIERERRVKTHLLTSKLSAMTL